jgi:hypothetical protein
LSAGLTRHSMRDTPEGERTGTAIRAVIEKPPFRF